MGIIPTPENNNNRFVNIKIINKNLSKLNIINLSHYKEHDFFYSSPSSTLTIPFDENNDDCFFFGTAANEKEKDTALELVDVELASYGYPNDSGRCSDDGAPKVHISVFSGVDAKPIFDFCTIKSSKCPT